MSDSKRQVTLAYPYTDAEGAKHKPDATVALDVAEANRLLAAGLARNAEKPAPADEKKG